MKKESVFSAVLLLAFAAFFSSASAEMTSYASAPDATAALSDEEIRYSKNSKICNDFFIDTIRRFSKPYSDNHVEFERGDEPLDFLGAWDIDISSDNTYVDYYFDRYCSIKTDETTFTVKSECEVSSGCNAGSSSDGTETIVKSSCVPAMIQELKNNQNNPNSAPLLCRIKKEGLILNAGLSDSGDAVNVTADLKNMDTKKYEIGISIDSSGNPHLSDGSQVEDMITGLLTSRIADDFSGTALGDADRGQIKLAYIAAALKATADEIGGCLSSEHLVYIPGFPVNIFCEAFLVFGGGRYVSPSAEPTGGVERPSNLPTSPSAPVRPSSPSTPSFPDGDADADADQGGGGGKSGGCSLICSTPSHCKR